jgi:hypothetical protein
LEWKSLQNFYSELLPFGDRHGSLIIMSRFVLHLVRIGAAATIAIGCTLRRASAFLITYTVSSTNMLITITGEQTDKAMDAATFFIPLVVIR